MTPTTQTATPSKAVSDSDTRMLGDRVHQLVEEVERLRRGTAARSRGRAFTLGVRWNDAGTHVDYLYRQHQLICRASDLETVLAAFSRIGQAQPSVTDGPVGLKVLDIGDRDAAHLADQICDALGTNGLAKPCL